MSRAIIKEFFKKKIEEGGDVDTILEWNKELCYMFPEDPHESEVVYQSRRITELENKIKALKVELTEAKHNLNIEELKAILDFLNLYAFVGWCLIRHPEKFNDLRDSITNGKEPDFYKQLIDEFHNEKLEEIEKAREENGYY